VVNLMLNTDAPPLPLLPAVPYCLYYHWAQATCRHDSQLPEPHSTEKLADQSNQ
jgi:hypothetical protein